MSEDDKRLCIKALELMHNHHMIGEVIYYYLRQIVEEDIRDE